MNLALSGLQLALPQFHSALSLIEDFALTLLFINVNGECSLLFDVIDFLEIETHQVHLGIVCCILRLLFYQIHLPEGASAQSPDKFKVLDALLGRPISYRLSGRLLLD